MADQMAKACQDISSLAFDLQVMVSNFKLGEDSRAAHAHSKALPASAPAATNEPERHAASAAAGGNA